MDVGRIHSAAKRQRSSGFSDPYQRRVIQRGHNIVRLIGGMGTVFRSWIYCGEEKTRPFNVRCILPPEVPNGPDRVLECGFLRGILDAVMGEGMYTVEEGRNGKKFRSYHLEGRDVFKIVGHNDSPDPKERGWQPKEISVLHCIPRDPVGAGWVRSNNHAMLLSKQDSEIGIGGTAIAALDEVSNVHGDPEEYDLDFTKSGSGQYDTKYGCALADVGLPGVEEGLLTDEEKALDLYDIDVLCAPAEPEYIAEHLTGMIERIDADLGTNFLQELDRMLGGGRVSTRRTAQTAATDGLASNSRKPRQLATDEQAPPRQARTPRKPRAATEEAPAEAPPVQKQVRKPRAAREEQEAAPPVESSEEMSPCPVCHTLAPMSATECPNPECKAQFKSQ